MLVQGASFRVHFDVFTAHGEGSFIMKVHEDWAPIGAAHFKKLVRNKHYDDSRFTRVLPDYVAQFGIAGDPNKVPLSVYDEFIRDEPQKGSNLYGHVSFAKKNLPDSRSTQIFINLKNNTQMDSQGFTVIGEIEAGGMKTVKEIYHCGDRVHPVEYMKKGNKYLDKKFPYLSEIRKAYIIGDGDL